MVIRGGGTRVAFAVSVVVALAAAACGTIADLDVKYDSVSATVDGGGGIDPTTTPDAAPQRIIRDSSFVEPVVPNPDPEHSDAGPCESDSDDGGGCDFAQGLGCCLLPISKGAGASACIYSWEIDTKCAGGKFVGCRNDDPYTESQCCWRDGPAGSRMSVYAASCDGGPRACNSEAGASCTDCVERTCTLAVGQFTIGRCGEQEACPQ